MMRRARILIPAFCLVMALASNTFGQLRKYTESFDRDRQGDPKIVETLQQLKTVHSKLSSEDLLKKINEWGAPHGASFKPDKEVIVMKVFWDIEEVESKPSEWRETEGMKHCFGVANTIMSAWNKDRSLRLVRFAGVELKAFPLDQKEGKLRDDGTRTLKVVASPEVVILIE